MLKCDLKNGKHTKIEMAGKLDEIMSDTLNLIKAVYKGICETNAEMAEEYRECMIRGLIDPSSGVWNDDERWIQVSFGVEDDRNEGILQ